MFGMKRETSVDRLRSRGLVLLILWLVVWGTAAAQPCCEALATLVPHHAAGVVPDQHQDDHHHSPKAPEQNHKHCPQTKPIDLAAATPALATTGQRASLAAHIALESPRQPLSMAAPIYRASLRYATPPPLSP